MTDLVQALRDYSRHDTDELMDKAADEIDRLRAVLKGAEAGRDSAINECANLRAAMELAERCHLEQAKQWKAELDLLRAENAELKSENIKLVTMVQDAENELFNLRQQLVNDRLATTDDSLKPAHDKADNT